MAFIKATILGAGLRLLGQKNLFPDTDTVIIGISIGPELYRYGQDQDGGKVIILQMRKFVRNTRGKELPSLPGGDPGRKIM